jgi:hypothetical protein
MVGMKRFQFSLRLLLLFMTLCVVVVAWLKARHDLWEIELRGKLTGLEISRKQNMWALEQPVYRDTGALPGIYSELTKVNAEINQIQQQLGQPTSKK